MQTETKAKHTPGVLIEPTTYGKFFIRDEDDRVWDGAEWRGFGAAELYPSYQDAFKARRAAIAKAEG